MFIVQADVVGKDVEWAIVGVCFWNRREVGRLAHGSRLAVDVTLVVHIMLRDEMTRAWMQRSCQERTEDEICKRPRSEPSHDGHVKGDLRHDIEKVNSGQRELIHHHRSKGIK